MIPLQLFNICIMESEAGLKTEGQAQTLQNRVRDAFRKGLQWKWERETGSPFSGSRNGAASQAQEATGPSAQKQWPHFAPVAIQRFKRLFSSDGSNNVPPDQSLEVGTKEPDGDVKSCTSQGSNKENQNAIDMVRVKTQNKKIHEGVEAKSLETVDDSASEQIPGHLHEALAERTSSLDSLKPVLRSENQDYIPQATNMSSSTMEEELLSSATQAKNVVEEMKASDEQLQSSEFDCSSYSKSIDCDLDNRKSLVMALQPYTDKKEVAVSVMKTSVADEKSVSYCPENGSITSTTGEIVKDKVCEESSIVQSKLKTMSSKKDSTNPSIVLSEISKTSDEHSKNSSKTLYLNIDPLNCSGSQARKSPVTVQEWVDSIPLSTHLEEDIEHEGSAADSSLNTIQSTEPGDVCSSSSIRPPSIQGSSAVGQRREAFSRDASPSLQSDTGSHGSSVDSFLDARRPDPEEVLLGLGFGGPLHSTEAEVSRIPARFLQPSKVKGVAIDDFLRYQQDLIETFESGHSGYRGLTGGAQIPSVIVAKIMEKLREHERESSTKSSAGSSPAHHAEVSKRRFSRAAHRVTILTKMKSRDSITSGPQAHSVLNPDNRKFLDNQGSKSPEVSRKRMIIGHRSFTFDGEGHLIETETNSEEGAALDTSTPIKPPLPRPLIHKDSVLSSATSLSLTSCDSDSETDEASTGEKSNEESGNGPRHHRLCRLLSTPVSPDTFNATCKKFGGDILKEDGKSSSEKRRLSLPSASDLLLNSLHSLKPSSKADAVVNGNSDAISLQTSTLEKIWKDLHRVNSAPAISPLCSSNFAVLEVHKEENFSTAVELNGQNENFPKHSRKKNSSLFPSASPETPHHQMSSPQSPTFTGMLPFYQISDFVLPNDNSSPLNSPGCQSSCSIDNPCSHHLQNHFSMSQSAVMFLDENIHCTQSLNSSLDSYLARNTAHSPRLKHWSTSSVSSWESEKDQLPKVGISEQLNNDTSVALEEQSESVSRLSDHDTSSASNRRRGSLKRQQNVDEDESVAHSTSTNLTVDTLNNVADQGDSFEMEELVVEDEVHGIRVGSAHSDSSGFQDEPNSNKEVNPRTTLRKQLSESEPMLHTQLLTEESEPTYSAEHLKRFSLPVIRVQDESGLIQWRACSIGGGSIPGPNSLRRVQSLPSQISRLGLGRLCGSISPGSVADSIGNMFSSCSDESVIHVPKTSVDVTQEQHPLHAAMIDSEGEMEALSTPRECCKCNCTMNNSLSVYHSDLEQSQMSCESLSRIRKGIETLRDAQNKIERTMQHVQSRVCSFPECTVNATLQQVASVIQQQSNLCLQLERLNSDMLLSVKSSSAQSHIDSSSSNQNILQNDVSKCKDTSNHPEKCELLSQVFETENRKLQDLVKMNLNELTQVRGLLERLLPNEKT